VFSDVGCVQHEVWNKNGRESDRRLQMMMTEQLLSMILELGVVVWDEHQHLEQQRKL
jgi:hypothetical protein